MKKLVILLFVLVITVTACILKQPTNVDKQPTNVNVTKGDKMVDTTKENTLYLDLDYGRVVIEMLPDVAPNHVKRIKELTRKGFYNGIKFHRVIDGFMAQTGDPTGTGMGGSGQKLKAEFNDTPHSRGAVSMARASDPDSADSQFFICFKDANFLDGNYTVWGKVVEGMEYVDMIKRGEPPVNPDIIVKMQVAADVKE